MVGGVSQASNQLNSIYSDLGNQLSNSLAKIASGKRTYNPTDDFGGYLKANAINASQVSLQRDKETIAAAQETTQAGIKFGQQVFEQVGKLRDLAQQYTSADPATQASLAAQFSAIQTTLTSFVTGAQANGVALNNATVNPTLTNMGTVSMSTVDLTTSLATASVTSGTGADVVLQEVSRYMAQMQTMNDTLKNLSALSDTTSTAMSNTKSAIEDINDVQELAKVTDLQIRQQAAISMMAQANSSRAGIVRLFS